MIKNECLVDINPDAMDFADLGRLAFDLRRLADYCENKHLAMGYRMKGDTYFAKCHEDVCDSIYKTLPESVKSW